MLLGMNSAIFRYEQCTLIQKIRKKKKNGCNLLDERLIPAVSALPAG
jgi:hypothetical protein